MITPHKTEVQSVARMLDAAEYETVDDLAHALLVKAWELYESRACRFVVAGQLVYQGDLTPTDEIEDRQELGRRPEVSPYIKPGDPRENLVALGPFPSLAQARTAGKSLADSTASREEYRWWAVPVWTGTPGAYHTHRQALRRQSVAPTLGHKHTGNTGGIVSNHPEVEKYLTIRTAGLDVDEDGSAEIKGLIRERVPGWEALRAAWPLEGDEALFEEES